MMDYSCSAVMHLVSYPFQRPKFDRPCINQWVQNPQIFLESLAAPSHVAREKFSIRYGNCFELRRANQSSKPRCEISSGFERWVHFIGIGGSGLSALALYALKQGWQVSGSDISWSKKLDDLQDAGARVHVGHDAAHLWREDGVKLADSIVVSSAIPSSNEELVMAHMLNLPIYKRGPWLAKLTESHNLIAISGSHGKTTTTAMLSITLNTLGYDVSAIVGADVPQFPGGGNALFGMGCYFVLEADEYDGCFLCLAPHLAVITNIEWEHVDIYPDEASVRDCFKKFVTCLKPGGILIICGDNSGARSVAAGLLEEMAIKDRLHHSVANWINWESDQVVLYGMEDQNDWCAVGLEDNAHGGMDYIAVYKGETMTRVSLNLPGVHNVLNSLAVIATVAVLALEGITTKDSQMQFMMQKKAAEAASKCLRDFVGVKRRFEFVGRVGNFHIYDDYAHHPTEVHAVLEATKQKFQQQPIWVIFQPHTYSRLAMLLEDFAKALSAADRVIVTEVYSVREENLWKISGVDLATSIVSPCTLYIPKLEDVLAYLVSEISDFHNSNLNSTQDIIILTLGAGDVTSLGPRLFNFFHRQ